MPSNHLLAEKAVIAISGILNQAGALSEQIRNDYGEDLLVQTHLNNYADNFRLLIQVKGATSKKGSRTIALRFKIDHLLRWISQSEPILVCVYDDTIGASYAFSPNERFSLWQLSTADKKTISVKLTEKDIFDTSTAREYIWSCRMDHWSRMLSWYENHFRHAHELGTHRSRHKSIALDGDVVVLSFLKAINIVDDDKISNEFREMIQNVSRNLAKNQEDISLHAGFMLALLGQVDKFCSRGMPPNLMFQGTDLCEYLFYVWHNDDWKTASNRFASEQPLPRRLNPTDH
jgi:hypothetical protein